MSERGAESLTISCQRNVPQVMSWFCVLYTTVSKKVHGSGCVTFQGESVDKVTKSSKHFLLRRRLCSNSF